MQTYADIYTLSQCCNVPIVFAVVEDIELLVCQNCAKVVRALSAKFDDIKSLKSTSTLACADEEIDLDIDQIDHFKIRHIVNSNERI